MLSLHAMRRARNGSNLGAAAACTPTLGPHPRFLSLSPYPGTYQTPSPNGTDLLHLYEHASREHIHGRTGDAHNEALFSWSNDKRPSALWVIEECTRDAGGGGKTASGWVFTQVSGRSVQCAFDTETVVEGKDGKM